MIGFQTFKEVDIAQVCPVDRLFLFECKQLLCFGDLRIIVGGIELLVLDSSNTFCHNYIVVASCGEPIIFHCEVSDILGIGIEFLQNGLSPSD